MLCIVIEYLFLSNQKKCILKSSTNKWIIGCLIGGIVILIAFLVVKENNII